MENKNLKEEVTKREMPKAVKAFFLGMTFLLVSGFGMSLCEVDVVIIGYFAKTVFLLTLMSILFFCCDDVEHGEA